MFVVYLALSIMKCSMPKLSWLEFGTVLMPYGTILCCFAYSSIAIITMGGYQKALLIFSLLC